MGGMCSQCKHRAPRRPPAPSSPSPARASTPALRRCPVRARRESARRSRLRKQEEHEVMLADVGRMKQDMVDMARQLERLRGEEEALRRENAQLLVGGHACMRSRHMAHMHACTHAAVLCSGLRCP